MTRVFADDHAPSQKDGLAGAATPADTIDAVFAAYADLAIWVAWWEARRGGKINKVPLDPNSGRPAKTNAPAT